MVVRDEMPRADRLLLVDDVVTKGTTLLAAATVLRRRWPHVQVSAFAAIRTCGLEPDIERILDPCDGTIAIDPGTGKVARQP